LINEKVSELKKLIRPGMAVPKPQKARERPATSNVKQSNLKVLTKKSVRNLNKFEAKLNESPAQKASA
jgi:hypothetical protein